MRIRLTATAVLATALLAIAATPSPANQFFQKAPGDNAAPAAGTAATACVVPDGPGGPYSSKYVHCHDPASIRSWYGVQQLPDKGDGQTIVLVDSYGTPTGAHDLQVFHDRFFPNEPKPDYDQVCKNQCKTYSSSDANGQSGPAAAAGWAGEATLDIEWAYAIAPHAHIVLLAVPPAETLGVQGFPNLFKVISDAIDAYPGGTVFSQSFGVSEATFGGAEQGQTARFDAGLQEGHRQGRHVLRLLGR